MEYSDNAAYMKRALELAVLGTGRTSPNPMVGAVIVKDSKIVGEGYHSRAGMPHAEIYALRQAGEAARGSTLYVTLEPCSHFGRTPPCVKAIVDSGIKKVVAAVLDPNPKVAGKGMAFLKNAGINCEVGILENEARKLNEVFFKYITTGKPFVTVKTAMTLDGKIATYTGDSRWITGEKARQFVHQLRNNYDAIMVGIGTVLADDPLLNTRLDMKETRDPVRVIIDGNLDLPEEGQIARSSINQRTLVFTARIEKADKARRLKAMGMEVIEVGGSPSQVPIDQVLDELGQREICSVLVEGGAELNAYLFEHKLVDKVYWFIAPKIIGGRNAVTPVAGNGLALMKDAMNLQDAEIERMDKDILITAYTGW
ncbi:MAG: bifunctional diaminohydroxyphosphoribosylaminopyrimidine deaminase/5-amino-6-(5-phosphoribosylamino)uracil reductase RibD [Syntrophomonadaceae bacterium]|jgi:diaminohydroxyphosphoribosylaminopyrimidine deaminase/5-amino-6-(5-phosphoribosylamino)uracil reductase